MSEVTHFDGPHDVLAEGAVMPYEAGHSPHTASARLPISLMRAVDKRYRGGRDAFCSALPADVGRFLAQPFNKRDRCDVWPFFYGIAHLARYLGQSPYDYLASAALASAKNDFSGAASSLLKLVSNRTITVGVFTMNKMWWDFLKFKTQTLPRGIRVTAQGLPSGLRNGVLLLGAPYSSEVLRLSGTPSAYYETGTYACPEPKPDSVGEGSFALMW